MKRLGFILKYGLTTKAQIPIVPILSVSGGTRHKAHEEYRINKHRELRST
jgi:hypothetical protein